MHHKNASRPLRGGDGNASRVASRPAPAAAPFGGASAFALAGPRSDGNPSPAKWPGASYWHAPGVRLAPHGRQCSAPRPGHLWPRGRMPRRMHARNRSVMHAHFPRVASGASRGAPGGSWQGVFPRVLDSRACAPGRAAPPGGRGRASRSWVGGGEYGFPLAQNRGATFKTSRSCVYSRSWDW